MIWAIRASVNESKCLDILNLGIFNNFGASSIFTWYKQILRQLLVLHILVVLIWYPWLLLPSFVMLMNLALWTLRTHQYHLSQCHLGVQLDLCILWNCGCSSEFYRWQIHQWRKNELFLPLLLSCFWLSSASMPGFSPLFPQSFSTAAFASGIFNAWGIGMILYTRLQRVVEFISFAVMWSWWGLCPAPFSLGLVLSSASTIQGLPLE